MELRVGGDHAAGARCPVRERSPVERKAVSQPGRQSASQEASRPVRTSVSKSAVELSVGGGHAAGTRSPICERDPVERLNGHQAGRQLVRYAAQGYLAHQKTPTPQDPPRTLGIGLRKSPNGMRFLVSEVAL